MAVGSGKFRLYSKIDPLLAAGDYRHVVTQTVDGSGGDAASIDVETQLTHVRVRAPRYQLPPDQVLSTFPPAGADGSFGARLPQIVIKRRTLPWERDLAGQPSSTPWLALVVIAEGEGELKLNQPVADCVTPGVTLDGVADSALGLGAARAPLGGAPGVPHPARRAAARPRPRGRHQRHRADDGRRRRVPVGGGRQPSPAGRRGRRGTAPAGQVPGVPDQPGGSVRRVDPRAAARSGRRHAATARPADRQRHHGRVRPDPDGVGGHVGGHQPGDQPRYVAPCRRAGVRRHAARRDARHQRRVDGHARVLG